MHMLQLHLQLLAIPSLFLSVSVLSYDGINYEYLHLIAHKSTHHNLQTTNYTQMHFFHLVVFVGFVHYMWQLFCKIFALPCTAIRQYQISDGQN